jgi:hypothetical protein
MSGRAPKRSLDSETSQPAAKRACDWQQTRVLNLKCSDSTPEARAKALTRFLLENLASGIPSSFMVEVEDATEGSVPKVIDVRRPVISSPVTLSLPASKSAPAAKPAAPSGPMDRPRRHGAARAELTVRAAPNLRAALPRDKPVDAAAAAPAPAPASHSPAEFIKVMEAMRKAIDAHPYLRVACPGTVPMFHNFLKTCAAMIHIDSMAPTILHSALEEADQCAEKSSTRYPACETGWYLSRMVLIDAIYRVAACFAARKTEGHRVYLPDNRLYIEWATGSNKVVVDCRIIEALMHGGVHEFDIIRKQKMHDFGPDLLARDDTVAISLKPDARKYVRERYVNHSPMLTETRVGIDVAKQVGILHGTAVFVGLLRGFGNNSMDSSLRGIQVLNALARSLV